MAVTVTCDRSPMVTVILSIITVLIGGLVTVTPNGPAVETVILE